MTVLHGDTWMRKGISLLWSSQALDKLEAVSEIVDLRGFFELAQDWPDDLPSANGNALVVAGLEACLDALEPLLITEWLKTRLYPTLLDFQQEFGSEAALIFWLPEAHPKRLYFDEGSETYRWHCSGAYQGQFIDLGHCIWSGVEREVQRIQNEAGAWLGLYQSRVS